MYIIFYIFDTTHAHTCTAFSQSSLYLSLSICIYIYIYIYIYTHYIYMHIYVRTMHTLTYTLQTYLLNNISPRITIHKFVQLIHKLPEVIVTNLVLFFAHNFRMYKIKLQNSRVGHRPFAPVCIPHVFSS